MSTSIRIVWFKRDIRTRDHGPLLDACRLGRVIPLYVFEPSVWSASDVDLSHFLFVRDSLIELDQRLRQLGGRLAVRVGEFPEVLAEFRALPWTALFSHEETGNQLTYCRDQRVSEWLRSYGIEWREYVQNGVVRRLKNRDGWAAKWNAHVRQPIFSEPARIEVPSSVEWGAIPKPESLGVHGDLGGVVMQAAGENEAQRTLESFLQHRSVGYRRGMSSPLTAPTECSRLSPYLAWGNLSVKQAYQATQAKILDLQQASNGDSRSHVGTGHIASLKSFVSRLSWHCHFIQKLESEPEIEFQNVCRLYDGLRENEFQVERFEAWKAGETGYPMIDACIRYLHEQRWINFRMRAMLMSFAAYHLWLHWREPSLFLARHFLDYEPGIHYSQCQMQSGVTGINTIRIYSPTKQLYDQDPQGEFVRRYVPELRNVPMVFLAEPHRMSVDDQIRFGCRIGTDYPVPIVNDREAVKKAKDRLYAIRQTPEAADAAVQVYRKHGSRKRSFRDPLPRAVSDGATSSSANANTTRSRAPRISRKSVAPKSVEGPVQLSLPGFDEERSLGS